MKKKKLVSKWQYFEFEIKVSFIGIRLISREREEHGKRFNNCTKISKINTIQCFDQELEHFLCLGHSALLAKAYQENTLDIGLSMHMGDGKVKLGRGPYAISTTILSMYAVV